jgi:Fibrinogen beta and gamma chains, C-terminal globular domain
MQIVYSDGSLASAMYGSFWITSEADNYRLQVSGYDGKTGGDMLDRDVTGSLKSNGQPFSTKDQDNDQCGSMSCAASKLGGWWYNCCAAGVLNANNYGVWSTNSAPLPAVSSSTMAITRL